MSISNASFAGTLTLVLDPMVRLTGVDVLLTPQFSCKAARYQSLWPLRESSSTSFPDLMCPWCHEQARGEQKEISGPVSSSLFQSLGQHLGGCFDDMRPLAIVMTIAFTNCLPLDWIACLLDVLFIILLTCRAFEGRAEREGWHIAQSRRSNLWACGLSGIHPAAPPGQHHLYALQH